FPASQRRDLGVEKRDEWQVAAVQQVREAALVALRRQRHVADDAVAVGLENRPLGSVLDAVRRLHGGPYRPKSPPARGIHVQWDKAPGLLFGYCGSRRFKALESRGDRINSACRPTLPIVDITLVSLSQVDSAMRDLVDAQFPRARRMPLTD